MRVSKSILERHICIYMVTMIKEWPGRVYEIKLRLIYFFLVTGRLC